MPLKDQNTVYVDSIRYSLSPNGDIANIRNCPITAMAPYLNNDHRSFDYDQISSLIQNQIYRASVVNGNNVPFHKIPTCSSSDFSGCCTIQTSKDLSTNEYYDHCYRDSGEGTSTGFMYKYRDTYYNICHSEQIQDKANMFSNFNNKKGGIEKFFMLLLVGIIVILFYTLISLTYEFWLRYGNSIQCIYYKVSDDCKNRGSKNSDENGKLTIIEYKFPDNLHNYPYEKCKSSENNDMKGGREKAGSINSNYIEYHENGSKCINVDFGDDPDNYNSKPIPYNLGQYANETIKNKFVAMILKGFSFYFLFTTLLLRKIFNKVLSYLSKQYHLPKYRY